MYSNYLFNWPGAKYLSCDRWSEILDKRNWTSLNPESFRKCLMAWRWAKYWDAMGPHNNQRPPFGKGRLSGLAPMLRIIENTQEGSGPLICLGDAKWGALAVALELVANNDPANNDACDRLFRITHDVRCVHLWDPSVWNVLPYTACSPLESQTIWPDKYENNVYVRQIELAIPLLKWAFSRKVALVWKELHILAEHLHCNVKGNDSREVLLEKLVRHIFVGDTAEAVDANVDAVLKADKDSKKMKVFLDIK